MLISIILKITENLKKMKNGNPKVTHVFVLLRHSFDEKLFSVYIKLIFSTLVEFEFIKRDIFNTLCGYFQL